MILFVCSQARIRSRTAEILCLLGGLDARCCGIDDTALVPINAELLREADRVICMERYHADYVRLLDGAQGVPVDWLSIPDEYLPMQPELAEELLRMSYRTHRPAFEAMARGWAAWQARSQ